MTVTILTGPDDADQIRFGVSPLAELGAALHILTGVDHPRTGWAGRTWAEMPSSWRDECVLFAPCWGGYRLRLLFPRRVYVDDDIDRDLDELSATSLDRAVELSAYSLTGGIDRATLAGAGGAAWLRRCAYGRAAGPAADLLLDDAAEFVRRLAAFLADSWRLFFAAEWARVRPVLCQAATRGARAVHDRGVSGLAGLVAPARAASNPSRVVVDKLHHGVVDLARTPLLVVPTVFGSPHVLVKHEPGWPAVLQYPHRSASSAAVRVRPPVETSLLRARLRLLADPTRVQLCRSIARHPRSTIELAAAFGMSPPEMSRHLRALRDAELVTTQRSGRFVLYTIRYGEIDRLGSDMLSALLR